jgi:hypothetical protein
MTRFYFSLHLSSPLFLTNGDHKMANETKLKLEDLKVNSFTTSKEIKGGGLIWTIPMSDPRLCKKML